MRLQILVVKGREVPQKNQQVEVKARRSNRETKNRMKNMLLNGDFNMS